jgi:predicted permease
MIWLGRVVHRLRAVFRRGTMERELDAELRFHLEMEAAQNERRGMRPDEAAIAARRAFGGVERTKDDCRDARGVRYVEELVQDVRYAVRSLRRSPALAATAVLTIALGVGANTAIMSAVYSLLLAPLPFANADRIVSLAYVRGQALWSPPPVLVEAWQARSRTLERISFFETGMVTLTEGEEPERLRSIAVAPDLPQLLGVQPLLGRSFLPEEATPGAAPVALLGHGLWQRRYAGSPDVLGRVIRLNGLPYTVVGVMPPDADLFLVYQTGQQLWTPLVRRPNDSTFSSIALMRPGVKAQDVERELTAITTSLGKADPHFRRSGASVNSFRESRGGAARELVLLLAGATGFVLLIACANVANLLLARGATRRHEITVRVAIGAGRGRVLRQLLTESTLLAFVGGAVGLLLAWQGLHLILVLRPDGLRDLDRVHLQPAMLGWCLGLSLVTGIVFGLVPALFATRPDVSASLAVGARPVAGPARTRRFGAALTTFEVALSVVLLVGTGLLVRTILVVYRFDFGFDVRNLVTMEVALPVERYRTAAQRMVIYDELLERVQKIPGAGTTTFALSIPPNTARALGELEIAGRSLDSTERVSNLAANVIQPGYFRAMGIRLLEGRMMASDSGAHEVLISRAFARSHWPGRSAVGERIRFSETTPWETIVGVVDDVYDLDDLAREHMGTSERRGRQIYHPFTGSLKSATLIIRTNGDTPALFSRITEEAKSLDPTIRVRGATTVRAAVAAKIADQRFAMALLSAFALMALMLAAVGLYGVIAYSVSQRTREIGVRMALGARPARVVGLVVWQGLRLTIMGLVIGLVSATALAGILRSQIIVSPLDPATYIAVGLVLGAVALAASYVPARRAARVDPVLALRAE